MAESGLDSLSETHQIRVAWKAFELRPAEVLPLSAAETERLRAYVKQGWPRVRDIARERFGLEMTRPEFDGRLSTRPAHVAAKFAQAQGHGDAFHRAVFRAYWQQGRDIGSADVLAEIGREVGLDEAALRAALADERYLAAVLEDEEWAYRHGLGGVPAFIFGNRYLVSGAQPAELLRQVANRCLEEGRTE
jgi:predicted DsbA family dithiol-disulfide isomerase